MLGHSKTVLVLLGGWAFLGDRVSSRQALGMALAVAGMVAYGVASSQCGPLAGMVPPGFSPVRLPARSAQARAPRAGSDENVATRTRRRAAGGARNAIEGGAADMSSLGRRS